MNDDTGITPAVRADRNKHVAENSDEHTGVWWWTTNILSYTLLAAMIAILAATIVVPFVAGATPYTILTSSMKPTYPPGSLVVVKPGEGRDIAVGSPITYQMRSGEPEVVTHRIVAVRQSGAGERTFITRGDNNDVDDENPVKQEQIRGKVWYSIPYLGYANNWLNGDKRTITVTVIASGLGLYALWMFVSAAVDHRKRRGSATP